MSVQVTVGAQALHLVVQRNRVAKPEEQLGKGYRCFCRCVSSAIVGKLLNFQSVE